MTDRSMALSAILATAPAHIAQAAAHWLNEDGIEECVDRPGEIQVASAIRLWKVRAFHVRRAGKELVGADEFLANLATLNPSKKLTQYSFHGAEHTGSVFFEKTSRKYVGLVMVEVNETQRQQQDETVPLAQHA